MSSGAVPVVECPSCNATSSVHEWNRDPHLGFANFALVFWNWAHFEEEAWRVNIRALVEKGLGRPLVLTFGHM